MGPSEQLPFTFQPNALQCWSTHSHTRTRTS